MARGRPRARVWSNLGHAVLIEDRKGDLVACLKDRGLIKLGGNTGAESS